VAKKRASDLAARNISDFYVRYPAELFDREKEHFLYNTALNRNSKEWAQLAHCLRVLDLKHDLRVEVFALGINSKRLANYVAETVFVTVTKRADYQIRERIFAMPFDPLENRANIPLISPCCPSVPYFEYLNNTQGIKVHEMFSVGESRDVTAYEILRRLIQEVREKKPWRQKQTDEQRFTHDVVIAAWKLKRESHVGQRFSTARLAKFLPKARSSYDENEFKKFPRALWAAKQIYANKLTLQNFGIDRTEIQD
jgi:hypothetical protein